jgi:hypothetical protein
MAGYDGRSNRGGILVERIIECPVCEQRAHSFRIVRVKDLRTLDGEFYHRRATCAGSMEPGLTAAMDLLRLAVEGSAESPGERDGQVESSRRQGRR